MKNLLIILALVFGSITVLFYLQNKSLKKDNEIQSNNVNELLFK